MFRQSHRWAIALVALGVGLSACGQPTTGAVALKGAGTQAALSPVFGARDAEVGAETNLETLNLQTDLDGVDEGDLADLATSAGLPVPEATASEPAGKRMTKVGFVRSNEDGRFFLQVRKGFLWWKKDTAVPLVGRDDKGTQSLAAHLNKKVIVCGRIQGESLSLTRVLSVPDFGVVWDLLSKGRVAGQVFDARTRVALPMADVTVRSFGNGRLWRAKADRNGRFRIGRLEAGAYTLEARSADFRLAYKDKVTVRKRDTAEVLIGLSPEQSAPQAVPVSN